jgi:hypothetical protein
MPKQETQQEFFNNVCVSILVVLVFYRREGCDSLSEQVWYFVSDDKNHDVDYVHTALKVLLKELEETNVPVILLRVISG